MVDGSGQRSEWKGDVLTAEAPHQDEGGAGRSVGSDTVLLPVHTVTVCSLTHAGGIV